MNTLKKLKKNLDKIISKFYWNHKSQKFLARFFVRYISIKDLASKSQKINQIQSEAIAVPKLNGMKLSDNFQYFPRTLNITLKESYTVTLSEVLYYPDEEIILTQSRQVIQESHSVILHMINPLNLYRYKVDKYTISGVCSVIRSTRFSRNYYHTLIDLLPRLYLLNQPEYKEISEIKLLFSSQPTKLEQFYLNKLAPKNVNVYVVENINKLYLIDQLIFPTFLNQFSSPYSYPKNYSLYDSLVNPHFVFQLCGCLPSVYLEYFHKKVLPQRTRNQINRIYISRSKTSSRAIINEDEIVDALAKYGFKKYYLEDLSFEEQIDLFYDACYVVSPHGAGLTNIIFSHQIKVLELWPIPYIFDPSYYFLCQSLGHIYQSWHSQENIKNINNFRRINFSVNISEILALINS